MAQWSGLGFVPVELAWGFANRARIPAWFHPSINAPHGYPRLRLYGSFKPPVPRFPRFRQTVVNQDVCLAVEIHSGKTWRARALNAVRTGFLFAQHGCGSAFEQTSLTRHCVGRKFHERPDTRGVPKVAMGKQP